MQLFQLCVLLPVAGVLAADTSVSVFVKDQVITEVQYGTTSKVDAAAVGQFQDTLMTTGWGILDVKGHKHASDLDQAFASGVVEGLLTFQRIHDHYQNMYKSHFGSLSASEVEQVKEWLGKQYNWTKTEVAANRDTSAVWEQVGNVMAQLDGLLAGYNKAAAASGSEIPQLTAFDFQVMNGDGDLFQIVPAVLKERRADFDKMTNNEAENYLARAGKCSSIIKVCEAKCPAFFYHPSFICETHLCLYVCMCVCVCLCVFFVVRDTAS